MPNLRLSDNPVAYSALAKAVVALLVLLEVVDWTPAQVAGVMAVADALLGVLIVKSTVAAKADAHQAGRDAATAEIASLADGQ